MKRRIGLVMDYFRGGVGEGAAAYARAKGLQVDPRWSVRGDWMSARPEWDGIIASVVDMPALEDRLPGLGLPVVLLGSLSKPVAWPMVIPDFEACGRLAFQELAETGVERVVAVTLGSREIDVDCRVGFLRAADEAGMPVAEFQSVPTGKKADLEDWVQAIADTLDRVAGPAGVFVVHAGVAYPLVTELQRRGRSIPGELAIVVIQKEVQGTAQMAPVPLTTVDPDNWQQGYVAAGLLHARFKGATLEQGVHRIPPGGVTRRDSTGVPVVRDPVVAKVQHAIREHYASPMKVEALAKIAGVSRRVLEARFRAATSGSVHQALSRQRVAAAEKLLRTSAMPLAEVAGACGYSSVHYFTTAFKQATGDSPGAFRKRHRRP